MSADVYIAKREKIHGYYQDDLKCETICDFQGWAAYDFIMGKATLNFNAEGAVVFTSSEDMGRVLTTMEEFYACYMENRYSNGFVYRVEQPFFDAIISRERYRKWSRFNDWPGEKSWVRKQLADFKKVIPTLDFEKYYYYILVST